MRRSLAAIAAATMLLVTVGPAAGAGPTPSSDPAPIVEPSPPTVEPAPPDPDPTPSIQPAPGEGADPAAEGTAGSRRRIDQSEAAPVVAAAATGRDRRAQAPRSAADPIGRWIVVLQSGTDASAAADRQGRRIGFTADRTFRHVLRGYSAVLDRSQVTALSHDSSVAMIVADERIQAEAQTTPTGISRVNATLSAVGKIDGIDERVDADVAIVDTGIARVPDLNVVGGYSCSNTSPR